MRILFMVILFFLAFVLIALLLIKAMKSEHQKQYFIVCALAIGLAAAGLCVLFSENRAAPNTFLNKGLNDGN